MKLKQYFDLSIAMDKKKEEKIINDLDKDLPVDIIKKLNDIKNIQITSTCSGHNTNNIFDVTNIIFMPKGYKNNNAEQEVERLKKLQSELKKYTDNEVEFFIFIDNNFCCWDSKHGQIKVRMRHPLNDWENAKKELVSKSLIEIKSDKTEENQRVWWENVYDSIVKVFEKANA